MARTPVRIALDTIHISAPVQRIVVEREDDEDGTITLTIIDDDGRVVTLSVGRLHDDAASLAEALENAAAEARIFVDNWEDRPEEFDGYVTQDGGDYRVSFNGKYLQAYDQRYEAVLALELASHREGYYPTFWYEAGGYTDALTPAEIVSAVNMALADTSAAEELRDIVGTSVEELEEARKNLPQDE